VELCRDKLMYHGEKLNLKYSLLPLWSMSVLNDDTVSFHCPIVVYLMILVSGASLTQVFWDLFPSLLYSLSCMS
jgi:hypothetical protein